MKPQTENTAATGQPQGVPSRPTDGQADASRPLPAPAQSGAGNPGGAAAFIGHIERLRAARQRTEAYLEALCPGHNAADASVSVALEKVFDFLCDNPHLDEPELTKIAGVIQKLSGAFNQIKGLELKLREEERRQAELEEKHNPTLRDKVSIDPEVLARIERELNLL